MRAAVLLAIATLAHAGLRRLGSGGLSEEIEQEGSEDSEASAEAGCWCRELEEVLDERAREASSEVNFLTTLRNQKHFENTGLRIEVQKHQRDAAEHQKSLSEGSALANAAAADHATDREVHESALRSLGKALQKIPEGAAGQVRGALEALNSSFTEKLREASDAHEMRAGAHEAALKAKEEMLRLAHEGARATRGRLEAGESAVAAADAKLSAYSAQQQADAAFRAAARGLCTTLQDQAEARKQLRQQVLIAISQAGVAAAQAAAAESRAGLVLTAAAGERSRVAGMPSMDALVVRSGDVESKLASSLTHAISTAQHVQVGILRVDGAVKDAIVKVGEKARSNLQAMEPLFGAVRSSGRECGKADLALRSALAGAVL